MLISLTDVERRIEQGELGALLGELGAGQEPERWLARALSRNRSLLAEHPELVFPCVYRLGWWHDAPAAKVFVGRMAPAPQPAPLRPLLEAWRRQWESMGRGPWLRALRPPLFPLQAPLLEEYRGLAGGSPSDLLPFFSPDDSVVGVRVGGAVSAWERSSGRLLSKEEREARLPAPAPPRFTLDSVTGNWGKCRIRETASGQVFDVDVDDDSSLGVIADAPDGHVLVGGWFDDYAGVLCRIDPRGRRVLWRREFSEPVGGIVVSADGRTALVHDPYRVDGSYLLDMGSGRTREQVSVGFGGAALSSQGQALAVALHGTLRVWDLEALCSGAWRPTSATHGFGGAGFSPDGELLLTGSVLCQAQTGRVIAVLELGAGGRYLEGGPAPGGQAMVRGGFIDIGEAGVRMWDARGKRILHDPSRMYRLPRFLSVSPDGRHYTVGETGNSPVEIELREVQDGRLVTCLSPRNSRRLKWSPDGECLASLTPQGEVRLLQLGNPERTLGKHESASGLTFSYDGRLLASRDDKGVILWDVASGRILAQGLLSDLLGARTPHGSLLHGFAGFRAHAHPYQGGFQSGIFEVFDERSGTVVARIPSDESLIPDPTGTRWAGGASHFALEER